MEASGYVVNIALCSYNQSQAFIADFMDPPPNLAGFSVFVARTEIFNSYNLVIDAVSATEGPQARTTLQLAWEKRVRVPTVTFSINMCPFVNGLRILFEHLHVCT